MPRKKAVPKKNYTPRKRFSRFRIRRKKSSKKILPGGPPMKYHKARISSVTAVAVTTPQVWQTVRYGIPW